VSAVAGATTCASPSLPSDCSACELVP
jgi:hypothetical protein